MVRTPVRRCWGKGRNFVAIRRIDCMRTRLLTMITATASIGAACSQSPSGVLSGGRPGADAGGPADDAGAVDLGPRDTGGPDAGAADTGGGPPQPLPEAASYQLRFHDIERVGDPAAIPAAHRDASPFEGDEVRVDPMPRFEGNLSLMVHAPFVGWPARMGPMDDPEPVAGEVVFSDPGCAICRPATIERPEIPASLRFPAFTVDYAEIDEQTLRWRPSARFEGTERYQLRDGTWAQVDVRGRITIRVDDVPPRAAFETHPRGVTLPWEPAVMRFSEPIVGEAIEIEATTPREIPVELELERALTLVDVVGAKVWPASFWASDVITLQYMGGPADAQGNVSTDLGHRMHLAHRPSPQTRLDFETDRFDVSSWGPDARRVEAPWCLGTGCFAIDLEPFEVSGMYAILSPAVGGTAGVRGRVRLLAESCADEGGVLRLGGGVEDRRSSQAFYPVVGPTVVARPRATTPPGFGCDSGWVDLQLDANPDGELVRQVGVMLEGSPDLGTLSGGVLVFDELLPF